MSIYLRTFGVFVFAMLFCLSSYSQKNKQDPPKNSTGTGSPAPTTIPPSGNPNPNPNSSLSKDTVDVDLMIYSFALKNNDYEVAINSLYRLIVRYPSASGLLDTLANLYFYSNRYVQCISVAKQLLQTDQNNVHLLEMVAVCEQYIGDTKSALAAYENLYGKTKSVAHLYQVAVLQYVLKRIGECSQSINTILQNAHDSVKVNITISEQYRQRVSVRAAALNLRGVILREQKNYAEARISFEQALKIEPEFILPKGNLDDMLRPSTPVNNNKPK
ncbi:MAG: tetratricopeptide repeat protein [Bacteroidia bacterium]|nr:tetratricopeptide repeat protein [Bacteroidia bacterium]